jgi:hypothetical protein
MGHYFKDNMVEMINQWDFFTAMHETFNGDAGHSVRNKDIQRLVH